MRSKSLLVLLSLCLISCGLFNRDTKNNDNPKIQKNSAFKPKCKRQTKDFFSVDCSSGSPACGTTSGSGDLRVYCIDKDDIISDESPFCCLHEGDVLTPCKKQPPTADSSIIPYCKLFSSGYEAPKVQKNSTFTPRCGVSTETPECSSGRPVCGTQSGNNLLKVFCIDFEDGALNIRPSCTSEKEYPNCTKT